MFHQRQLDIDTALSYTLGQPVTITREASISHLDAGPVHLLTPAALAWLRAALPAEVPMPGRIKRGDRGRAPGHNT
jgi:hypothetical protein